MCQYPTERKRFCLYNQLDSSVRLRQYLSTKRKCINITYIIYLNLFWYNKLKFFLPTKKNYVMYFFSILIIHAIFTL